MLRVVCAARDAQTQHAAWFDAHLELARTLAQAGKHEEARDVVGAVAEHATPRERAHLDCLEVVILTRLGLMTEAVERGRRAAAVFGVELPAAPKDLTRQTQLAMAGILERAAAERVESWFALPPMTDPDLLAAMNLLVEMQPSAYQTDPRLFVLISARVVGLALRHGVCGAAATGFTGFAIALWTMHEYALSYRFGKFGTYLARHLDARTHISSTELAFCTFVAPWQRPLAESVERLTANVPVAIAAGDTGNAGYSSVYAIAYRHMRGEPLPELIEDAGRLAKLCRRLGLEEHAALLGWQAWYQRAFTGAPAVHGDDAAVDFGAIERMLSARGSLEVLAVVRTIELERRSWSGDLAGALQLAPALVAALPNLPGHMYTVEIALYLCLAKLALHGALGPDEERMRANLARYAHAHPENFLHHAKLVEAEVARTRNAPEAPALYEAAIDAAADHGFLKIEILARELAARYWIGRGRLAFAAAHLAKARDLCEHWGARPRAAQLERERRSLGAAGDSATTYRADVAGSSTLDFATVMKASQAIASDMNLDSLLGKIMEIIVENTGAQAGSIVLERGGALFVHASRRPNAQVTVIHGGQPLAQASDVPEGIVRYVVRTTERVVLGDAARHPIFRADPYVRTRRPRSVLCLPIAHGERIAGAVYLENNLVADAFTVERLDAVRILVAQLAISIEHAMMFSRLEDLVAERTRELVEANRQLQEQAVLRARMESELRLAQKLQSVGQLAAGVAHEINTPLQYVGDNVTFLGDALGSFVELVDAYRAEIAGGTVGREALAQLEADLDLDFLRTNARDACAQAKEGVARVSKIVVAMKAFSHPDRAEQTPTALEPALESALVVAQNAYRHVADVVTDFAGLPHVVCHAGELNQVFLNLIVNAAHAIEDVVRQRGGRGTITVRTRRDGEHAVVAISDTGTGIPDTIRERVFDPFFTTKEVGRGTGQGLALARNAVVTRHGGTIDLTTRVGEGTTFEIRIPIAGRTVALAS
ncbi:MAG: GAF domain-containing protein [Deltaproteobacteria bacterium]|nr:GAF domain-containing protein [Deltaproteobacteria bacterium]